MYSHLRRERGGQNGGHQEDPAVLRRHLSSQSASGNREGPSAAVQPRPGGNSRGCSTGSWHSLIPAALTFSSGGDGGSWTPRARPSRADLVCWERWFTASGQIVCAAHPGQSRSASKPQERPSAAGLAWPTGTVLEQERCWAWEERGGGRGQCSLQSPRRTHPLPCPLRQTFLVLWCPLVSSPELPWCFPAVFPLSAQGLPAPCWPWEGEACPDSGAAGRQRAAVKGEAQKRLSDVADVVSSELALNSACWRVGMISETCSICGACTGEEDQHQNLGSNLFASWFPLQKDKPRL